MWFVYITNKIIRRRACEINNIFAVSLHFFERLLPKNSEMANARVNFSPVSRAHLSDGAASKERDRGR